MIFFGKQHSKKNDHEPKLGNPSGGEKNFLGDCTLFFSLFVLRCHTRKEEDLGASNRKKLS